MAIAFSTQVKKRKKPIQECILKWAESNLRDYPWRRSRTPYRIFVAEFLLKRTTASAVNRVYDNFIQKFPNFDNIINSSESRLEDELKSLGLQRIRAVQIKEASNQIVREENGIIPNDINSLLKIKNIGPYTAGAILSLGYGKKAPMVDSNVIRIVRRVFANYREDVENKKKVNKIVIYLLPEKKFDIFNLALLDLGATICTYRSTKCQKCPLKSICDFS